MIIESIHDDNDKKTKICRFIDQKMLFIEIKILMFTCASLFKVTIVCDIYIQHQEKLSVVVVNVYLVYSEYKSVVPYLDQSIFFWL